ncbi:hypothetical protein Golax_010474 [Gossypium laxum]|uniref:Uncharacterized protein n=1 Tax=Gossypium laxum TaxID=34288 RepID=A0A7J8ZHC3_9ROSI|nr:hypothetical protein [Gossypium laxum]
MHTPVVSGLLTVAFIIYQIVLS